MNYKKCYEKQKGLSDAKIELIAWLNDECPICFPPLKPYTTADLGNDFAEGLRERLDNIILRSQILENSALESEQEGMTTEEYLTDACKHFTMRYDSFPALVENETALTVFDFVCTTMGHYSVLCQPKGELYEKIIIECKEDLPKISGLYFVGVKSKGISPNDLYNWYDYRNPIMEDQQNDFWINTFDWYLKSLAKDEINK